VYIINFDDCSISRSRDMIGAPKFTRSSADAKGPRYVPQIQNIAFEKVCNSGMTFKDTQGHYNCCY